MLRRLFLFIVAIGLGLTFPDYSQATTEVFKRDESQAVCVSEACRQGANCEFQSELQKVITLCQASNGECVRVACQESGDCPFEASLGAIIRDCQGVNGSCVEAACDAGGARCDLDSDLKKILNLCKRP